MLPSRPYWLVLLLYACGVDPAAPGVDPGEERPAPESDGIGAREGAIEAALDAWAGPDLPIVVLDIVAAETFDGEPGPDGAPTLWTAATVVVVEVLRGAVPAGAPADGRPFVLDLPGGTRDAGTPTEVSIVTSDAPLVYADDRVVARMRPQGATLGFDGSWSVLPMEADRVVACVNPDPDATRRCVDQGDPVLHADGFPSFADADFAASFELSHLRNR